MKRLSLPRTINPHAKHFTDSVSNVLYGMEKFESRALAWPTCRGASRKKKDLGSRQDCSFPEVPLAQSPSSLYPFHQSRPRGWWENSSQVRKKNIFYQILQENQDRDSKTYPHTPLNVPLMPVYHPIQNGINIRNMSYTTRPPNDGKVYTKQNDPAEKIPSLGVNPIHRVKRLPVPPVIADVARNASKMQRSPSGKRKAPTPAATTNEPRFMLSSSSKKVETRPNSIRTLTQHKKSTGNPQKRTPSKPLRFSLKGRRKHPDTISITRSRRSLKSDTGSIATAILDEIVVAERQSLLPARSLTEVRPYEQRLPDNQTDQGEQRRSTIRENRSRMELFDNNKKEDTPRASYEEQLNRFRELLEANTSTQNYNNEIDIEQIVPADVLNYPYPMLPEDAPKGIDPSIQTKTKINPKPNGGAGKTKPPLQQQVAPKKHECCICQALHRNRIKDAPFIVEMKREQKRQELLAYRTKMLAANPSLSAGVWCKTLDSYDQLIHQQVS